MSEEFNVYKVDDGEFHWVVASSPEQAVDTLSKVYGFDVREEAELNGFEVEVTQLDSDKKLTVSFDDEALAESCGDYESENGRYHVPQTAAEWVEHAVEHEYSLLGSTVF